MGVFRDSSAPSSAYSDGAPLDGFAPPGTGNSSYSAPSAGVLGPPSSTPHGVPISQEQEPSAILRVEGPRGRSTRTAVIFRYIGFFAAIALCSAVAEAVTAGVPNASKAGAWMFASCTVMSLAAAVGTAAFPANRLEVLEQWRHFLFGLCLFPGTGIAIFIWATSGLFSSTSNDAFAGLMADALPILYFVTVVIPTLIFIKWVAGQRTIYRSRMDDQEMVEMWTRQTGGYQR